MSGEKRIMSKARAVISDSADSRDAALRIFRWVRDSVLFDATMDIRLTPAETLRRRIVDYSNKIHLHAALLRAVGIPARYHIVKLEKTVLKPVVPRFIYRFLPSPVGHFFCECLVGDRWVACEALYDAPFYEGLLQRGEISRNRVPTIDWDGETDLVVLKDWMVAEDRITSDYEAIIRLSVEAGMPPYPLCRLSERVVAGLSRRSTNAIRERGINR
jgi:hypothetical protein